MMKNSIFVQCLVILICFLDEGHFLEGYMEQNTSYYNSTDYVTIDENVQLNCDTFIYNGSFTILKNGSVSIAKLDISYDPEFFHVSDGLLFLCTNGSQLRGPTPPLTVENCTMWVYEPHEFKVLPSGEVLLEDELLKNGTYQIKGDTLEVCIPDNEDYQDYLNQNTVDTAENMHLAYVGKVGSAISVTALSLHLLIFCTIPKFRNLPGYNLTSLCISLLLAYLWVLIGQIPEVLGTFCTVSAIFQHYFFLVYFFWMNVIAFDIWRAMRLSTQKFIANSSHMKIKKFIWYSLYSWGLPVLICVSAAIVDNTKSFPDKFKPFFGKNKFCWFNNYFAKTVFMVVPAFTLFVINSIFFGLSTYMIVSNTFENSGSKQRDIKENFILYARLGIITGINWLIAIAAVIFNKSELWFVFDVFHSLQGLLVFVLFSCSKKVWKQLVTRRYSSSKNSCQKISSSSVGKSEAP